MSRRFGHTGASMHALSWTSKAWQPAILCPDDAQHADQISLTYNSICRGQGILLSTEDMIARHGLFSAWFVRRTLSRGSGGSRMGFSFVEAPFGGISTTARSCNGLQLNKHVISVVVTGLWRRSRSASTFYAL